MLNFFLLLLFSLTADPRLHLKPTPKPNSVKAPFTDIDIQHYRLNIKLDMTNRQIDACCTIKILPKDTYINEVSLDFWNLTTDSVKTENSKLAFVHSSGILKITLDRQYSPSDTINLSVFYHGKPSKGLYFGSSKPNTAWTQTEPEDSRFWFPCNDIPSDKADMGVEQIYTLPKDIILQANGLLYSRTTSGDVSTWSYKHNYPIATYLIAFAAAPYDSLIQSYNGMPVTHYFDSNYSASRKNQLSNFPTLINLCEQYYGVFPFRNERIGTMEYWMNPQYCMEHQTMISMNGWGYEYTWVIFHELSHQWWGDHVTCGTWYDTWLNESWATFSEYLYAHKIENYKWADYRKIERDNVVYSDSWEKSILDCFGCESLTYGKGAFVMEMLRQRIDVTDSIYPGSQFFSSLRQYGSEYSYRSAVTEDFILSWEHSTNDSLRDFLMQWLGGIGHPIVEYRIVSDGNSADIYLEQRQKKDHPNASLFTFPLEIKFNGADRETLISVEMNNSTFRDTVDIGFNATSWTLDPNSKLLAEYGHYSKFDDKKRAEYLPVNIDYYIYPNPTRDDCYVRFNTERKLKGRIAVYDIAGRKRIEKDIPAPYNGKTIVLLPVRKLSSGIYLVNVQIEGKNINKKLAIMK
ncbi:MAG: T9SS type A sorting domain-containing protein [Candidatus Coatesbacteria bacterium]|nr:T9SS type A sorting domain-containing protein [Candidatus Coatesbacteria bacterium]